MLDLSSNSTTLVYTSSTAVIEYEYSKKWGVYE